MSRFHKSKEVEVVEREGTRSRGARDDLQALEMMLGLVSQGRLAKLKVPSFTVTSILKPSQNLARNPLVS